MIEIDGESHYHDLAPIKDSERQKILTNLGLSFLRFDDLDVKRQMPYVLNTIMRFMEKFESN